MWKMGGTNVLEGDLAFVFMVYAISLILTIATMIPYYIGLWKLYEKAGEKGWKCLIPFYNMYILYEIVYGNGWKMFFLFIPVFNIVVSMAVMFRLAEVFGKSTAFGVGLLFLKYIFMLVLAFDSSEYEGSVEDVFI